MFVELSNGVVGATRGPNDGNNFYTYQTAAALDTSPVVCSGSLYVGAQDGGFYAFTPFGNDPMDGAVQTRSRNG